MSAALVRGEVALVYSPFGSARGLLMRSFFIPHTRIWDSIHKCYHISTQSPERYTRLLTLQDRRNALTRQLWTASEPFWRHVRSDPLLEAAHTVRLEVTPSYGKHHTERGNSL